MEKLVISSSVLVAATKLIKASARSGGREISRNVLLLVGIVNPRAASFARDNERRGRMHSYECRSALNTGGGGGRVVERLLR